MVLKSLTCKQCPVISERRALDSSISDHQVDSFAAIKTSDANIDNIDNSVNVNNSVQI